MQARSPKMNSAIRTVHDLTISEDYRALERAAASEGKIGEIVDLRTNINSLELKYLGLLID